MYLDKIQFTGIADGANEDDFDLSGLTVTLGKGAVATNGAPVTLLTDGYKLKLGQGMTAPLTVKASYTDNVYTTAGKTEGYTLASDKKSITYTDATTKQIEFSGVDSDTTVNDFSVTGNVITIGKDAVREDGTPVEVLTAGYTLKLGKGMTAPTNKAATYANNVYTTAGKSDGYTLASNKKSITYTEDTTKQIQFSGLDSDTTVNDFIVTGNVITIGKDAVREDGTAVKVLTDGYTFALGDLPESKEVKAKTYESSTMTYYYTKGTTVGYILSDDAQSIYYNAETTSVGFTFSGVDDDATASNFYVKGNVITIGKAAVQTDGTALTLTEASDGGSYILKLGQGMTASKEDAGSLTEDVYTFGGQTAGYSLSDDKQTITYTDATDSTLELSGVMSKLLTPSSGVVSLSVENFSDKISVVKNDGDFSFTIAEDDYEGKTFVGGSGGDTVQNGGDYLCINSGAGNDRISTGGDHVTIDAGANNDYVLNSGANVSINGGAGNDTLLGGKYKETLVGGNGNDILNGGAGNDSLSGGKGKDTLWGGKGNDTLLGGDGTDVFIYKPNEGTDTIMDFTEDDLLQILDADGLEGSFTDSTFSNGKLTLSIDGGGSVVINNVASGDSFYINDNTYTFNGDRLVTSD